MTSTLQKTQREAKIDGQIKNYAGKQFATPPQPTLSVAGFRLTMVRVSTVSIVYNLRMDHYGVRKYRNIENQKISNCVSIRLPEKTITSNFQLDRSIKKVGRPIQIIPLQKPSISASYCRPAQSLRKFTYPKTLQIFFQNIIYFFR